MKVIQTKVNTYKINYKIFTNRDDKSFSDSMLVKATNDSKAKSYAKFLIHRNVAKQFTQPIRYAIHVSDCEVLG